MASLAPLLRVQALGAFGVGRLMNERDPKARRRVVLAAVGISLLVAYAVGYMWMVGKTLVALGAVEALPCLAVTTAGVGCVFSTFVKANGLLFRFGDFDLVVSMPAPLWAVVVSRVAPLYGMGLVCSLVLGAPLMASYLLAIGVTPAGVIVSVLVLLLAPAIPLALALVVSFCVAWAASRTPFADRALGIVGVLATVALVVGVMLATGGTGTSGQGGLDALAVMGGQMRGAVSALWPPSAWAADAIGGSMPALALYAGVSTASGVAVVAVLSRFLVPMNSLLCAGGLRRAGSAPTRAGAPRSPLVALVRKEFRLWFGTPIYLMNTAPGPILALVIAIATAAIGPDAIASAMNIPGADRDTVTTLMAEVLLWALGLCMVMTSPAASSTSLEGSARWIAQTAPVPSSTIVGAKLALSLLVTGPASVISGTIVAVGVARTPLDAIPCVIAPLAMGALSSCLGALLDARRPNYDWMSEYEPVKRSVNVGICVGVGFLATMAGAVASLLASGLGSVAGLAVALAVLVASALLGKSALHTSLQER